MESILVIEDCALDVVERYGALVSAFNVDVCLRDAPDQLPTDHNFNLVQPQNCFRVDYRAIFIDGLCGLYWKFLRTAGLDDRRDRIYVVSIGPEVIRDAERRGYNYYWVDIKDSESQSKLKDFLARTLC
ncbi:hypothetical protein KC644_03500 [Candidatus Berkelbacteria bacterium]|nr:hypothetical protein [Candidatus Berkelbacteria bacterium]